MSLLAKSWDSDFYVGIIEPPDITAGTIAAKIAMSRVCQGGGFKDLDINSPSDLLQRELDSAGIKNVNLTKNLGTVFGNPYYWPYDQHLTPIGHEKIAARIERFLLTLPY